MIGMRNRARAFALKAHGSQQYGPFPYQYHLARVVEAADEFYAELDGPIAHELLTAAAWLHDVLEDTETTVRDLHVAFGPTVTALVVALTDEEGRNRAERHSRTYPKLRGAGRQAVGLKLCDRLANLRGCIELGNDRMLQMYEQEHADFVRVLHRPGEMSELWRELNLTLHGVASRSGSR